MQSQIPVLSRLVLAAQFGDLNKVRILLKSTAADEVNSVDEHGNSPLMLASGNGHIQIAKLLLKRGADVNITNELGSTALIWACTHGSLDIVQLLIDNGANMDTQNSYGISALMTAVTYNNVPLTRYLIEKGASKEIRDENKRMAIQYAKSDAMRTLIMTTRKILAEGEGVRV